jgi:large conductance mechanosensitive channel
MVLRRFRYITTIALTSDRGAIYSAFLGEDGLESCPADMELGKGERLMLKEFKEFAMKGSVVDMAVGIIIGAAFGTIVKSLVADVIMPPIGLALGNVDFTNLFVVLKEGATAGPYASLADAKEAGAVTVNYGAFINTVISFLIVAFAVFLLIRNINRMKREEEAPPPEPTTKECPHCLSEIPIKATKCAHCTSEIGAA